MNQTSHDKIAALLQEIANETGEVVERISISWFTVHECEGTKNFVNVVEIESVKSVGVQ